MPLYASPDDGSPHLFCGGSYCCRSGDDMPYAVELLADAPTCDPVTLVDQLQVELVDDEDLEEDCPKVVPHLVRLVTDRAMRADTRAAVLGLLRTIAMVAEADEESAVFSRTHAAFATAGRELSTLRDDADPGVRAAAHALAPHLDRSVALTARCVADLVAELSAETRVGRRMYYVRELGDIGGYDAIRPSLDDASIDVREAAVAALLRVEAPGSPVWKGMRAAIGRLVEFRTTLRPLGYSPDDDPARPRMRGEDYLKALCDSGADLAREMFPEIMRLVGSAERATELVPVLDTFGPERASLDTLTQEQSAILATISRNRHFYRGSTEFLMLLDDRGLPNRSGALRALAARGPAGHESLVPAPPEPGPAALELAHLVGRQEPDSVSLLQISFVASDELLALLPAYAALRQLKIGSSPVTAAGLAHLAALPALTDLILEDLTLDSAAGRALAGVGALGDLRLIDVTAEPSALAELGSGLRCETLFLAGFTGSRAALDSLRGCDPRSLSLFESHLEPGALAALADYPRLEKLWTGTVDVPTDDLAQLCAARPELEVTTE